MENFCHLFRKSTECICTFPHLPDFTAAIWILSTLMTTDLGNSSVGHEDEPGEISRTRSSGGSVYIHPRSQVLELTFHDRSWIPSKAYEKSVNGKLTLKVTQWMDPMSLTSSLLQENAL
mmetsp:Transcript_13029/g.51645  ORF Transcript_13029/g.51645 Transcript_13029/m.51645 type:complete len:119 (+) Transcript_13029:5702-6058(+)